ncbi:hypothetical protein N7501_003402 [Penicillium viridicatum]|nr:hypothetical protein N7501_003402 [Penicillium viridicatum]
MSNRNDRSDESLVDLGSIEGQNIQAASRSENNNRNNINNRRRRCNNSNYRRPSQDSPSGIEQESDAEPEAENNQRNNANNRRHCTNSYTSDDNPPSIERLGSDAEEEGENILVYEGNVSDEDGEAELFLQTMWLISELLDYTAEISGLPMEGTVLAWRGNGPGKSVIVGYTCGGSVTARLILAARRFIPSRAPNISEQSLGRRRDHIRTERDIQGPNILIKTDEQSVGGDASWESRETLRFVCASDQLKTDMLIYNVAKELEYPAASTYIKNEHWRNVNVYRGVYWSQPRAEKNRRIMTIGYEPAFPREDNSQQFDSGIGMNDNGTFQEGYYEGSNEAEEMDNVEEVQDDREQRYGDVQQLRRDLSPIYEEVSEARSFFTPNDSPTRVRWHGETQQRHGIFTPRATRSPSSGYIPQGNRDPARGMPETPINRRVLHLDQGNQQRTPPFNRNDQRGQQRQTPQSNRSNRSNQGNQPNQSNQQRTPQPSQGSQQRQTPQSNRSNQGNQPNQGNQQQTPQPGQGSQQRQTPQSNRSNRSNQGSQPNHGNQQRTPQPGQGSQQRQTPQSNRSNRSNQGNQPNQGNQQRTPQPSQDSQQRQTPQSNRSNRSNQGSQPNHGNQQRTPQPGQGSQQRQTPQSNRSNRSNQGNQPNQGNQQRTPQSSQGSQQRQTPQGNRSNQGNQQRTPQSNRSNRSNRANQGNQQRTPPLNQSDQSSQQRQTPQSNRSNQGNHIDHRSAESSMAVPEVNGGVNGGLTQVRRGRHRARPWDRTTIGTRRSTRIASITERP